MKLVLSLFLLSIIPFACSASMQSYSDFYSLHISDKEYMRWYMFSGLGTHADTLYHTDGTPFLHYVPGKILSSLLPLQLKASQKILLPDTDCRNGEVIVRYGNKDITHAGLTVSLYDSGMQRINSYSVSLPISCDTAHVSFPLEKADFLTLNIDMVEKFTKSSGFDIYGIEIYLDGQNIDSFPLNMGAYKKLAGIKTRNRMPDIPYKRIIGIGENMHGTSTLPQKGIEIIKDRILNHNCRLVLLEYSPEYVINLNHFANDTTYLEREDVKDFVEAIGKDWFDFFRWVNEVNKNADRKTIIAGIDNIDKMHDNLRYLLYLMSHRFGDPHLENILAAMTSEKLLATLESDTTVWKYFDKHEKYIIMNSMRQDISASKQNYRILQRDSLMAENTENLLRLFCKNDESAVIYAHYEHTGKVHFSNTPEAQKPLGKILSEKYGDEYYSVALWGMQGKRSYFMKDSLMFKTLRMTDYPHECIEYGMKHINQVFSIPAENFPDNAILAGGSGNIPTSYNFSFINFRKGTDNVIFIPEVKAADIAPDAVTKINERSLFILMRGMKKLKEKVCKEKTLRLKADQKEIK